MTVKPKIALATGHANTNAGGHPGERALVAPIVRFLGRRLLELGADVRFITPQEGLGMYPDGLQAVARQINVYSVAGWKADVFLEIHAEGNSIGDKGRGSFAIYPDKLGDHDYDVRDKLGPALAAAVATATGIPARTAGVVKPGVMSETQTGIGSQAGKRLGAFIGSYASRQFCTRLLYEVGSMTSPADMKIMQAAGFHEKAGRSLAEAIAVAYGISIPVPKPAAPARAPVIRQFRVTAPFGTCLFAGRSATSGVVAGKACGEIVPIVEVIRENRSTEGARLDGQPDLWGRTDAGSFLYLPLTAEVK